LFGKLVIKIRSKFDTITNDLWVTTVNGFSSWLEYYNSSYPSYYSDNKSYVSYLLNNMPKRLNITYTTRYNSFLTADQMKNYFGATDPTTGEGTFINNNTPGFLDSVDYVNLMIYDDIFNTPNNTGYNNITNFSIASTLPYTTVYTDIVNATLGVGVPGTKIVCGVEPGVQAGAPSAPDQTGDIINIANIVHNNNLGGIMFWAINDNTQVDFSSYVSQISNLYGYKV
jgi:hypothetical protein